MASHFQDGFHLHMSQPRGSNSVEEEENEAQNEAQDAPDKTMEQRWRPLNNQSTSMGDMEGFFKVQRGHVLRSLPRKDRHSKVYTSNGPRDRRFRLSAQTAIEFYDVQDRLGYDRPSKAIDWLMKKAKASIDALDESSTTHQPHQQNQGCNAEPETFENHQHFDQSNMKDASKEPVFDYSEESLHSAYNFSEANLMEMGWLQSLMAWNYNAGDGGEGSSFNSSHVSSIQQ